MQHGEHQARQAQLLAAPGHIIGGVLELGKDAPGAVLDLGKGAAGAVMDALSGGAGVQRAARVACMAAAAIGYKGRQIET